MRHMSEEITEWLSRNLCIEQLRALDNFIYTLEEREDMKRFVVDYELKGFHYFEAKNIEEAREMVKNGKINEVINNQVDDITINGVYED